VATLRFGARAGVNFFLGAKDALRAADHFRNDPCEDAARLSFAGDSDVTLDSSKMIV
jgi:hypothetical protein